MATLEKQYDAIPEPTQDVAALLKTVQALKRVVEALTGQGNRNTKGLGDQFTDIKSVLGKNEARFSQYIEVQTGKNSALVKRTTLLEGRTETAEGKITNLEEVVIEGDNALVRKVETLEAENTTVSGKVTNLEEVVLNGDNALVRKVEELEARDPNGMADGKLTWIVGAGPDGYIASYDLALTAGMAKAGLTLLAKQDAQGNYSSSIAFTANQFMLFDPALGAMPVFNYIGGLFTFNVPVKIKGEEIEERAITNFSSSVVGTFDAACLITARDGSTIDIVADFGGQPDVSFPANNAIQFLVINRITGSVTTEVARRRCSYYLDRAASPDRVFFIYTAVFVQDNPPPGQHTYQIVATHQQGPTSIKVTEFYR